MARMINRTIYAAFAVLIVGACQSVPATPEPANSDDIEIVSVSRQSPYSVNFYIDHPGQAIAGEVWTDFWRKWSEGGWGVRVQLKDRVRVDFIEAAIENGAVSRKLTDRERVRFLARVRMVIESEREPGKIYYVDGCNFIKTGSSDLFVAADVIRKYYVHFDLYPDCP